MLIVSRVGLSACLAPLAIILGAQQAMAACVEKCDVDRQFGGCRIVCDDVSTGGHPGGGAGTEPRICTFNGDPITCDTAIGSWSSYASAWCRPAPVQPDFSDPIWRGHTDGTVYECVRPLRDGIPDPNSLALWWLPTAPEAPDPEDLARRLLASIEFQSPELGIFPRGDTMRTMGYVGWNAWLWAAPSSPLQWGPVTDSISEGGVTVTLTANVVRMVWDMGNGDTFACGMGTPWSSAATRGGRNIASPTCGYMYEEDGIYTVTGTSEWDVDWSGGGRSGTIPLTLSRDVEVIVGELQSVNVGG